MSFLPQVLITPEGVSVKRLVEYGRSPYMSHWGKLSLQDKEIVHKAMQEKQVNELAKQSVSDLLVVKDNEHGLRWSLAQNTNIVMLD